MVAETELAEYLDEIRRQVCSRCVERPPGGPPCAPLGKACGVEMHLPQLVAAIHAVQSESIGPYLETNRREICATCPMLHGEQCPCPMDYLAVLVVDAVETVDRRHNGDAGAATTPADRERKIRAARVTLTVEGGKHQGKQFDFDTRTTCLAGRSDGCRIRLTDDPSSPFISRYHCLFDIDPPAIRVQDLGSRNGTYVNGDNIGRRAGAPVAEPADGLALEYALADGDEITLGGIPLRVHVMEPPAPAATSDGSCGTP
jgi:hypothetical protein